MSDKSPVSASWSKSNSEKMPHVGESIIIPNEDVFDLKDYINSENIAENNPKLEEMVPVIEQPVSHPTQTVNPEHIRRQKEEKYFYHPDHKIKSKETSNWFIVTFLMTIVILG